MFREDSIASLSFFWLSIGTSTLTSFFEISPQLAAKALAASSAFALSALVLARLLPMSAADAFVASIALGASIPANAFLMLTASWEKNPDAPSYTHLNRS